MAVRVRFRTRVLRVGWRKMAFCCDLLQISGKLVKLNIILFTFELLRKLLLATHGCRSVHLLGNLHGGERSQRFEGALQGLNVVMLVVAGVFLLREGRVVAVRLPLEGGEDVVVVVDLDLALVLLLNFLHMKLIKVKSIIGRSPC